MPRSNIRMREIEVVSYAARPGFHITDEEAAIAGPFLEDLRNTLAEKGLPLTTQDIVNAAEPESSPIHGHFDWDDARAANEYRNSQAGYLVRSILVNVVIESSDDDSGTSEIAVRQFYNVESTESRPIQIPVKGSLPQPIKGRGYVGYDVLFVDDNAMAYVKRDFRRRLRNLRREYAMLLDAEEKLRFLLEEIDSVLASDVLAMEDVAE